MSVTKLCELLRRRAPFDPRIVIERTNDSKIRAEGIEDISTIDVDVYRSAKSIWIYFAPDISSPQDFNVYICFSRNPDKDSQLDWTLASFLKVTSAEIELVYAFKNVREIFEEWCITAGELEGFPSLGLERKLAYQQAKDAEEKRRLELHRQTLERLKVQTELLTTSGEGQVSLVEEVETAVPERIVEVRNSEFSWLRWLIGTAITAGALYLAYRQYDSTKKQADVAITQASRDSSALFKLVAPPRQQYPEDTSGKSVLIDFQIANVGKSAATKVKLVRGEPDANGPHVDIGTVGPGENKDIHLQVSIDPKDLLHEQDHLCLYSQSFTYEDGLGEHHIFFDPAENANTK